MHVNVGLIASTKITRRKMQQSWRWMGDVISEKVLCHLAVWKFIVFGLTDSCEVNFVRQDDDSNLLYLIH